MNKSEALALIEAVKELARAVDALTATCEQLQPHKKNYPIFAYTCGTCGEKGKGGVDFGVGGFMCDECMAKARR